MIRDMETLGEHLPGGQAADSAAKGPSSRSGDERLGPGTAHGSYVELGHTLEPAIARAKLERWFWSGIFGEVYEGAVETS